MKLTVISSAADRRLLDEGRETRAMVWIMAIMLFLTVLAAAFGLGALSAARALDQQLAGKLTLQIVNADPAQRDAEAARLLAEMRRAPQVARAEPVDRAQLAQLLRPWLGEDGADPDLPIPAMIDVELRAGTPAAVAAATDLIHRVAPAARIDRYESWMSPVSRFMQVMIALAAGLVLLMAAATATVVVLAARAGLDSHRDTIEMLHMLGSTDAQVARLFQRRLALDTLLGGAIGTVAALAMVAFLGAQIAGLGADLVSGVVFTARDWVLLLGLPVAFALLATWVARAAVLGALRRYL
ncbi:FtsX-like permease family protein [Sphingomonas sp.]|uniref:cell division protein FtsX n=1 Tax=Sphingomonas sp. TaxID=28214 RepID=UPI001D93485E|nr:FtsX-like permease family protein [Sphingomonas sp.]MBX9795542.1 permease [Sphingomonas sp.]